MNQQIEDLKKESQRIEDLPMLSKLKPSERLIAGLLSVVDELEYRISKIERRAENGS